ncbi:hypothetical protein BC938DRAFT_473738, partial [Jimgerdemannia flammicorona]
RLGLAPTLRNCFDLTSFCNTTCDRDQKGCSPSTRKKKESNYQCVGMPPSRPYRVDTFPDSVCERKRSVNSWGQLGNFVIKTDAQTRQVIGFRTIATSCLGFKTSVQARIFAVPSGCGYTA